MGARELLFSLQIVTLHGDSSGTTGSTAAHLARRNWLSPFGFPQIRPRHPEPKGYLSCIEIGSTTAATL
jgi:hypothetical protein